MWEQELAAIKNQASNASILKSDLLKDLNNKLKQFQSRLLY